MDFLFIIKWKFLHSTKKSWYQEELCLFILRCKSFSNILVLIVCLQWHNPFWPVGLKYAIYFLCTEKTLCYIDAAFEIVWISCFGHTLGIKQNWLWHLYFCMMVMFCVIVLQIADCLYLYKDIYDWIDVKLFWGTFGNGSLLMTSHVQNWNNF